MIRYEHVLDRVYNRPHPVMPEKLEAIRLAVTNRVLGVQVDGEVLAAARAQRDERQQTDQRNGVAVLPICGTIMKKAGMMEETSGGASIDRISREFDRLLADSAVEAIVLAVDSPGGEGFGVPELAEKIFSARSDKRVECSIDPEMASAALWIGMAAGKGRVNCLKSGWVGSIGVYMCHTDLSQWSESSGVKYDYISAGEYKTEWRSDKPLADETRAYYQAQVDSIYKEFIDDVARFRGTTQKDVRENYGKGRMLRAEQALRVGMIDRVETLDETVSRLAGRRVAARKSPRASTELERLRLEKFR